MVHSQTQAIGEILMLVVVQMHAVQRHRLITVLMDYGCTQAMKQGRIGQVRIRNYPHLLEKYTMQVHG